MSKIYTENLSDFGYREIKLLRDILNAWLEDGLPDTFDNSDVRPAMNRNSGFVFLVNSEYQVAMMNENKLDLFHSLPYGGAEGFLNDLVNEFTPDDLHPDDFRYLQEIANQTNYPLPSPWLD